jgi:hypothetical protein
MHYKYIYYLNSPTYFDLLGHVQEYYLTLKAGPQDCDIFILL